MKNALFILGMLSERDIDWLLAAGQRDHIPSGSVLIREGQPIAAFYVILEGLFTVSARTADPQALAQLGSGEILGEMSFVEARPPSATVTAAQDSVVLSVPCDAIQARLEREPDFGARFYRALAVFLSARLRDMDRQLAVSQGAAHLPDADELDPVVLEAVHLAGSRFQRMLRQVARGEGAAIR